MCARVSKTDEMINIRRDSVGIEHGLCVVRHCGRCMAAITCHWANRAAFRLRLCRKIMFANAFASSYNAVNAFGLTVRLVYGRRRWKSVGRAKLAHETCEARNEQKYSSNGRTKRRKHKYDEVADFNVCNRRYEIDMRLPAMQKTNVDVELIERIGLKKNRKFRAVP